jgi:hypothetical protein
MKATKKECPNCKTLTSSLIGTLQYKGITTKEYECSECKSHFTNNVSNKKILEFSKTTPFTYDEIKDFNNEFNLPYKELDSILMLACRCNVTLEGLAAALKELDSFNNFQIEVKHYCNKSDFEANKEKLINLRIGSYSSFINFLKLGGEITTSIRACDEIFKMSVETKLTESELVELSTRFRLINAILDEQIYK